MRVDVCSLLVWIVSRVWAAAHPYTVRHGNPQEEVWDLLSKHVDPCGNNNLLNVLVCSWAVCVPLVHLLFAAEVVILCSVALGVSHFTWLSALAGGSFSEGGLGRPGC